MPVVTPRQKKQLQQAIEKYPAFFYDLFLELSFSNSDLDKKSKDFSALRKFFASDEEWHHIINLFTDKDASRLTGPATVISPSKFNVELPEDQVPAIRASLEINSFYDFRHLFKEILDERNGEPKELTSEQKQQFNQRLVRLLDNAANQIFVDDFMWPILMDLVNPPGKRRIDAYLKHRNKQKTIQPKNEAPVKPPVQFMIPAKVPNIDAWFNMVKEIYSGKSSITRQIFIQATQKAASWINSNKTIVASTALSIIPPMPEYEKEEIYSRAVTTFEQGLGLTFSEQPASKNFISNAIYASIIHTLAYELVMSGKAPDQIASTVNTLFANDNNNTKLVITQRILALIQKAMQENSYNVQLDFGTFKLEFSAPNITGKRRHYLYKANAKKVAISEEDTYKLIEQHVLEALANKHSSIYKDIASTLPSLETILNIAKYGSYAQAIINEIAAFAIKDHFSIAETYALLEKNTIKNPDYYIVFSATQKRLYDILGDQLNKTAKNALAYKFAKFALQLAKTAKENATGETLPEPEVSPKMIHLFKNETTGREKRIQYLVLEMIANGITPPLISYTKFSEINEATALYHRCFAAARNSDYAPISKDDVVLINRRISNGQLTNADLQAIMSEELKSKLEQPATKGTKIMYNLFMVQDLAKKQAAKIATVSFTSMPKIPRAPKNPPKNLRSS